MFTQQKTMNLVNVIVRIYLNIQNALNVFFTKLKISFFEDSLNYYCTRLESPTFLTNTEIPINGYKNENNKIPDNENNDDNGSNKTLDDGNNKIPNCKNSNANENDKGIVSKLIIILCKL